MHVPVGSVTYNLPRVRLQTCRGFTERDDCKIQTDLKSHRRQTPFTLLTPFTIVITKEMGD